MGRDTLVERLIWVPRSRTGRGSAGHPWKSVVSLGCRWPGLGPVRGRADDMGGGEDPFARPDHPATRRRHGSRTTPGPASDLR